MRPVVTCRTVITTEHDTRVLANEKLLSIQCSSLDRFLRESGQTFAVSPGFLVAASDSVSNVQGSFLPRVALSVPALGWIESEIRAWAAARISKRE